MATGKSAALKATGSSLTSWHNYQLVVTALGNFFPDVQIYDDTSFRSAVVATTLVSMYTEEITVEQRSVATSRCEIHCFLAKCRVVVWRSYVEGTFWYRT